jgi:hypothetical protein
MNWIIFKVTICSSKNVISIKAHTDDDIVFLQILKFWYANGIPLQLCHLLQKLEIKEKCAVDSLYWSRGAQLQILCAQWNWWWNALSCKISISPIHNGIISSCKMYFDTIVLFYFKFRYSTITLCFNDCICPHVFNSDNKVLNWIELKLLDVMINFENASHLLRSLHLNLSL